MGTDKIEGTWQSYYPLSFSFNISGKQYLYGVNEYDWFIQELVHGL